MNYTLSEIASVVHGELLQNGSPTSFHRIITDSRSIENGKHAVFFAIVGKQHNGHHYLNDLYNRGVRHFIVSEKSVMPKDCSVLLVHDTLDTLQQLAVYHRSSYHLPIIAVTGSNGKTIIKEWLYQLLREDYNIVRSPKSYNSQLGVPLSVLLINPHHDLGIFEAGISLPGEMEKLAYIIQPEWGILTNIGTAHSENFSSRLAQLEEKCQLFKGAKKIFYCADDEMVHHYLQEHFLSDQLISWGSNEDCLLQILEAKTEINSTVITGKYNNERISITIPFTDKASQENAIHCWLVLLSRHVSPEIIRQRFSVLSPIEMRLEIINGINDCTLINDTYNSDVNSLSIALDFMNQQKNEGRKVLILSDIFQDKNDDELLYKKVADLVSDNKIEQLIGVGTKISAFRNLFPANSRFYNNTETLLKDIQTDFKKDLILIKGARSFHFEKITERLQDKAHETILRINLTAMANNLAYYRSKLKPGVKIMAMVKAFSYGSGSAEIATALEYNRTDYLAVAYADEGVALRKAGITLPIMVMNPERKSFGNMIRYHLEPEIYSFHMLDELLSALKEFHYENIFGIHLKIDTGMKRLGFSPDETQTLIHKIKSAPQLRVLSVFSHLAGSDNPDLDKFTRQQISDFETVTDQLEEILDYRFIKHIANSAAISRFHAAQMDMVRLGIGLYGIAFNEEDKKHLEPVSTLTTVISQIKNIDAGETVGYNRAGKSDRPGRIAIVPIGYADGFSRLLSNGKGGMLIRGKYAPVIGNICMDMTMLDITEIAEAKEGDEVMVFGKELPVEKIAEITGTIPYEILTSVSARVKRVYSRD